MMLDSSIRKNGAILFFLFIGSTFDYLREGSENS